MTTPKTNPTGPWWMRWLASLARGGALFFGGFTLLGLVGELLHPGFDASLWWLDLRAWPGWLSLPFRWMAALLLSAYALAPSSVRWRRWATVGAAAGLSLIALWDALRFYRLWLGGELASAPPVPLSLLLGAGFALIAWMAWRPAAGSWIGVAVAFLLAGVSFPVAQMLSFGRTSYARPADIAVVFGARAYADGRPSHALRDRMNTACQLYQRGLVRALYLSGGPGDGEFHETDVMRTMALAQGVRAEDILIDREGNNTRQTAENLAPELRRRGLGRVLAVSHFYHLPRVKLAFQREGIEVFTVPAEEPRLLLRLPYYMVRETAGLWAYYLGPLFPFEALGG